MDRPSIPKCAPECATSLGIKPGTGESEKCYGCRQEAKADATPGGAIKLKFKEKKRRPMTNCQ